MSICVCNASNTPAGPDEENQMVTHILAANIRPTVISPAVEKGAFEGWGVRIG
jgi:hypothetical protein